MYKIYKYILGNKWCFDIDIDSTADPVWPDLKSVAREGAKVVILAKETKWSQNGRGVGRAYALFAYGGVGKWVKYPTE